MPRAPLSIPSGLEWWRGVPGGDAWLDRLPGLVSECAEKWTLELEAPFEPASISLVLPARREDGSAAVLKLNFPELESEREPDALAYWDGRGAVRLLARDDVRRALLVERCEPGTTLWTVAEDEANEIAADVLRLLWRPVRHEHPFRLLGDAAAGWVRELPGCWERLGRPFERELLDRAVSFLRESTPAHEVVVHQDFHGGNVLRASREPWLAIDPKPLVGEREFDTASLLRDRRVELARDPHPGRTMRRRLDLLSERLGLDRERMRQWGIAHGLAWGLEESAVIQAHVECARLLASIR